MRNTSWACVLKYLKNKGHKFNLITISCEFVTMHLWRHVLCRQSSTFSVYKELYEKEISRKSNRVRNHVEGLERVKRNSDYIYLGKFLLAAAYIV